MKSEVLEKNILASNQELVDNIQKFPKLHGSICIIYHFKDGGITGREFIITQKKKN